MLLAALPAARTSQATDPPINGGEAGQSLRGEAPLEIGSGWIPFSWSANGQPFADQGGFTFSSADPAVLRVTDAFCNGDAFQIFADGRPLGNSSAVDLAPCNFDPIDNPDAAFASADFSRRTLTLAPGAYTITIRVIANPFGMGKGYLRVDTAPPPAPFLDLPFAYDGTATTFGQLVQDRDSAPLGAVRAWFDHDDRAGYAAAYDGVVYDTAAGCGEMFARCFDGHQGIDFSPPAGARAILPAAGGIVVEARTGCPSLGGDGCGDGLGNFVVVDHGNDYFTLYGNLARVDVAVDREVSRGRALGIAGSGGASTETSFHFALARDGGDTAWGGIAAERPDDPFGWPGTPSADPAGPPSDYLWIVPTRSSPLWTATWSAPGDVGPSSPTVVTLAGRTYSFRRGDDGALYVLPSPGGSSPAGWLRIGGVLVDGPAAAVQGGAIYVVARGVAPEDPAVNPLYVTASRDGVNFAAWSRLGGNLSAAPAMVRCGALLCVFARGEDDALYAARLDASDVGARAEWQRLGGHLTSAPAATAFGDRVSVFVRGSDRAIYRLDASGGQWSVWYNLGGVATSAPAAATVVRGGVATTFVFARGADNTLWERHADSGQGYSGWLSLGGALSGAPGVSGAPDALTVIAPMHDGLLRTRHLLPR